MGDSITYASSQDGFKSATSYEEYLQQRKQELLGIRKEMRQLTKKVELKQPDGSLSVIEQPVQQQLADGSWQEVWQEQEIHASMETRLVNEEGADYIIRNLRKFFNKHSSMADLRTNEECARLAARGVQSIYTHLEANCEIYGIQPEKFAALEGEFDTDMMSVYMLLTSMRDGGLRMFGKDTQGSNYNVNNSAGPEQKKGLIGG